MRAAHGRGAIAGTFACVRFPKQNIPTKNMSTKQPSRRAGQVVRKSSAAISSGRRAFRPSAGRRRLLPRNFILLALIILAAVGAFSYGRGKVVKVNDGDTLTMLNNDGKFEKIRLYGIDCPESDQPGGSDATAFAGELAFLEEIGLTPVNTDRYGRTVGLVHLPNGRMLNEELLRNGHAWVYRNYCDEPWCVSWIMLENRAREEKKGLWAAPGKPVPPWKWREKKRR